MPNYANIKGSTQTGKSGGYKALLLHAHVSDIDVWARPIALPIALGDKVKIVTAHTFVDDKTAFQWDAQIHSVKHTSATVGEEGAQELEHTAELVILGDNPATLEQMVNILNDQKVVWLKDADCINNDSYIQLGDDCVPVTVTLAFDGSTTKEGMKKYTLTIKCKKKFFYLAALDVAV
ncbi:MAG: hypothetical protein ACTHMC_05235 [Pseudobacter sp.]|uniref:hypothetical protein n=1 Tax=Pseudobacter sp. TaxID=2045420 RepID=UPI003F8144C8